MFPSSEGLEKVELWGLPGMAVAIENGYKVTRGNILKIDCGNSCMIVLYQTEWNMYLIWWTLLYGNNISIKT